MLSEPVGTVLYVVIVHCLKANLRTVNRDQCLGVLYGNSLPYRLSENLFILYGDDQGGVMRYETCR